MANEEQDEVWGPVDPPEVVSGAEAATQAAVQLVGEDPFLRGLSGEAGLEDRLWERLIAVSRAYWKGRRSFEQELPEAAAARASMERVEGMTHELRAILASLPESHRKKLDRCTYARMKRRLSDDGRKKPVDRILRGLEKACQDAKPFWRGPGRRKARHIATLATDCAEFWTELSGRKFGKTIETTAKGSEEYVANGPRFMHRLMVAIDPDLEFATVNTALKGLKLTSDGQSSDFWDDL